jgi:hypothetical protein
LDTFEKVFLVGEVGIAAIHSLGFASGLVERTEEAAGEYDKMKEFFEQLF